MLLLLRSCPLPGWLPAYPRSCLPVCRDDLLQTMYYSYCYRNDFRNLATHCKAASDKTTNRPQEQHAGTKEEASQEVLRWQHDARKPVAQQRDLHRVHHLQIDDDDYEPVRTRVSTCMHLPAQACGANRCHPQPPMAKEKICSGHKLKHKLWTGPLDPVMRKMQRLCGVSSDGDDSTRLMISQEQTGMTWAMFLTAAVLCAIVLIRVIF